MKSLFDEDQYRTSIDLSNQNINLIDSSSLLFMSKFTKLKAIDLSDNQLISLPANLSMLDQIEELNLANNPFESVE